MTGAQAPSDVVVVGAGMVGTTLAALLVRAGFSVALVEMKAPPAFDPEQPVGLRVSALSPGSESIIRATGAWAAIESQRCCPYLRMQVEDAAHDAVIGFDAPEFGLERLGTIVENAAIQSALWQAARSSPLLRLLCPDSVRDWRNGSDAAELTLASGESLTAPLVVAADGAGSALRSMAGIDQQVWDYGQKGVVGVVRTRAVNPGTAWQRFMPGGPLAYLPLSDGSSSVVWTRPAGEAIALLELDEAAFCTALSEASGDWLDGVERCGPRAAFPLAMRAAERDIAERLVLLGDAAHVVHPLAGQGVNLGLADAAALTELLIAQRQAGRDIGAFALLRRYERWRRSENAVMSRGIHLLGGAHAMPAIAPLRRLGAGLVSRSWFAREAFVRRAAGRGRNAPRLARGEALESLLRRN